MPESPKRTALYGLCAAAWQFLCAGITTHVDRRARQHIIDKPWGKDVPRLVQARNEPSSFAVIRRRG